MALSSSSFKFYHHVGLKKCCSGYSIIYKKCLFKQHSETFFIVQIKIQPQIEAALAVQHSAEKLPH